ncbi:hypothetical protein [Paenibacillus harenae]|uniref:Uncharacterized protein n=1 Tax=Paenibacillus harenae TaxID=306543 RepID=A0ABT9U3U5_PAEHA|nr:hypothetical protein [Paenibacillus harenae]MDQ0114321.1 hypothetical protein [Paenibacillus harenae]
MDRKTLDYMEERARKARLLFNKIESLLEQSKKAEAASSMQIIDRNNVNLFFLSANRAQYNHPRLIDKIAASLQQLIAEEIALLEQELSEL